MPLVGTLRDLSLPNLVQLQCSEQNETQVYLTHQAQQGKLVFSNGELVFASVDDQVGEAAVYQLLTWEDAHFQVRSDVAAVVRNIETSWGSLLLEGLRLADEQRAERDATLEAALRNLRGKHGLRAALVASGSGQLRADAKEQHSQEDAALVAFVAGRAEALGSLLNMGTLSEVLANHPAEKIMLRKLGFNYLGGWLDQRAAIEAVRTLLQLLDQ